MSERPRRRRRQEQLDAAEIARNYPQFLERVPAVLYIAEVGDAGRWHYVSPQIEALLGFSPAEWCADPHLWEERLHPDDRKTTLEHEHASTDGEREYGAVEYRMLHRDGRVVWIRDDASLVADEDGQERWHGVLSDVTDRKQVEAELEQLAAQQKAVAMLGEHALEGATTSELMDEAVSAAARILGVELTGVVQLLPKSEGFVLKAGHGWPDRAIGRTHFPSGTKSHAGYTVLQHAPVAVEDYTTERRFGRSAALEALDVRSGLSALIEGRTRTPFGVLGAMSLRPRHFTAADIDFLQSLANVLADALERQEVEDDIRHRALHDPLTGLPNRALFLDRLEHALARLRRRKLMAAILFLDFDRFKLVNDSLGHQVGDELLAAAAPRLKQALRSSDTVARFGGDEFGILLEDITGERDAIEMAERIAAIFARPFVLAGNEHFVTASIGIALAQGGERAEELIRDADAAMYRAKERGRARYELFDEMMRARAIARLRVENDLRRALERDELRLDYQPVVVVGDHRIVSAEALVRWDHPERGAIAPSEFIPVAEEDGLIEPIGRWVLETACRQAVRWQRERPDAAPVGISVNLSPVQLAMRELPQVVATTLAATGLDPACLRLEITETVMLGDAETFGAALRALSATGVKIALDDFGRGYSSLAYVSRLPLDALKIDRSFVDGLGSERLDTAITEAIVGMARALSLEVIAEGVESELQLQELARLGCTLAQGFYFSPPLAAHELSAALREGPPWVKPQGKR